MRIWAAHLPHEGDLALFLEHKDAVAYVEHWNADYLSRMTDPDHRLDFLQGGAMRVIPREVLHHFDPGEV